MNRAVLISCPSHLPATLSRTAAAISRVGGVAAEQAADVGLVEGEEAVAELAVGGQPDPVAAHAERPADRGDQADPAAAVDVVVIDGRGPRVLVGGGRERADPRGQAVEDLGREEHLVALPAVAGVERHVLDEPQLQAVLAGEPGQRDDVLLGHPLDRHGVDLHRVEARPSLAARMPSITCSKPGPPGQLAGTGPGPSCRG